MHADELADLLRWCAALSPDPANLAGAVVLAAGQRWSRLVDSPADLRELTVRTFLHTAEVAEPRARPGMERFPEELRTIVAAYDKLPKLQRAVVMLTCLEGVTHAEIAGVLDRPPSRVNIELDRALATINADPFSVRAALDIATWHLPAPAEVSRAFRRHARTRTRRRRQIGLVGVAAGTLLCVLVAISVVYQPEVVPRQSGNWTFSHVVRPTPGWSIRSRTVEQDWETTILRSDVAHAGRCSVAVGTAGASWVRKLPRAPTRVRLGTRPAFYAEGVWPNGGGAMLWWEYADNAWVIIECGSVATPRKVLPQIASHVVLSSEPILLPYRVRSLPRHYQVASVTKGLVTNSTVAHLTRYDYPEAIVHVSIRYPAGMPMFGVDHSALMARYANGRNAGACRLFGDSNLCVRGEISTLGTINIAEQRSALRIIDHIATNLELAPSPTDETTWFDARDALPS